MQLERAFKDFIEVHEIDNQSFYTIRNYRRYISAFLKWLKSEHTIIDTDDLKVSHLQWYRILPRLFHLRTQKTSQFHWWC